MRAPGEQPSPNTQPTTVSNDGSTVPLGHVWEEKGHIERLLYAQVDLKAPGTSQLGMGPAKPPAQRCAHCTLPCPLLLQLLGPPGAGAPAEFSSKLGGCNEAGPHLYASRVVPAAPPALPPMECMLCDLVTPRPPRTPPGLTCHDWALAPGWTASTACQQLTPWGVTASRGSATLSPPAPPGGPPGPQRGAMMEGSPLSPGVPMRCVSPPGLSPNGLDNLTRAGRNPSHSVSRCPVHLPTRAPGSRGGHCHRGAGAGLQVPAPGHT